MLVVVWVLVVVVDSSLMDWLTTYPHKFCIAHELLRLLLYMALISSNVYRVLIKYLKLR